MYPTSRLRSRSICSDVATRRNCPHRHLTIVGLVLSSVVWLAHGRPLMADSLDVIVSGQAKQLLDPDEGTRLAALASLSEIAADVYGNDAALLGQQIRDSGAIAMLVNCLRETTDEVKQCSLSLLGNLLTDVFDTDAAFSLALFSECGGLPLLLDILTQEYPLNLYAAAALQNVTALDPMEACAKLRDLGAAEALRTLASSPDEQVVMFATGALANIRAYDPDPVKDPELEEALRLRRLRDIVEAMQSSRAVDKVQFYARRWIQRRRDAALAMQSVARGCRERKARQLEVAERLAAATALQASYRGKLCRDQQAALKEQRKRSAALLQARYRGLATRKAVEVQMADAPAKAPAAEVAESAPTPAPPAAEPEPPPPAAAEPAPPPHAASEPAPPPLAAAEPEPPPPAGDGLGNGDAGAVITLGPDDNYSVRIVGDGLGNGDAGAVAKLETTPPPPAAEPESPPPAAETATEHAHAGIIRSEMDNVLDVLGDPATAAREAAAGSTAEEAAAATKLQAIKRGQAAREASRAEASAKQLAAAMNTDEGYAELRALFQTLDKDGDGTVTSKEWGAAVSKNKELLGKYFGGATAKEIGMAFKRLDADGSGDLSWEEFVEGAESLSTGGAAPPPLPPPPPPPRSSQPADASSGLVGEGRTVLVFGEGASALSAALGKRCGGTMLDLPTLSALAEEDPSAEGEALLASQASGALPGLKVVLPLLRRTMASRNAPFVLNGYPRMGKQVADMEASVGRVSLCVHTGEMSATDANLAKWLSKEGKVLHSAAGSAEADVAGVLDAMRAAGIAFSPMDAATIAAREAAAGSTPEEAPRVPSPPPVPPRPTRPPRPQSAARQRPPPIEPVPATLTPAQLDALRAELVPKRVQLAEPPPLDATLPPQPRGPEDFNQTELRARRVILEQRAEYLRRERLGRADPRSEIGSAADMDDGSRSRHGSGDQERRRGANSPKRGRARPHSAPAQHVKMVLSADGTAQLLGPHPPSDGPALWPHASMQHERKVLFAKHYATNARLQQVHRIYGQYLGAATVRPAAPRIILVDAGHGCTFPVPKSLPVGAMRPAPRPPRPSSARSIAASPSVRAPPPPPLGAGINPLSSTEKVLAEAMRVLEAAN